MKHVLYLQTGHQSLTESAKEFLTGRTYQALFCDEPGKRKKLRECLESLEAGDTLFLLRENLLADDVTGYVRILRDLTDRGVNVWVERAKRMFSSESSPFSKAVGEEEADAFERLWKTFFVQQLPETEEKSVKRAAKPRKHLPQGFEAARVEWLSGRSTGKEGASRCGMPLATFRKWARQSVETSVNYGCIAAR